jgi:beta-lactam-binding protein with PASTA domain
VADIDLGVLVDGRYRVLSRLGAGGMADVFLADDQQLGRKVALKLLHRRFAEDGAFVERFRREAQAAAGLQHPNVVSVYDRGSVEGTYYIAMEYLPGVTLKELIRREAPLDPVRAIDIALQVLAAAGFAHRSGVIHRDIKPHNVIVDEQGHAKVTDFGIARAGASDMTETGSIMGTAQYLSPEQAQGHAVSPASDIYSVGVMLFEMLSGRVPFEGDSPVTIALKHVSEPPPALRSLNRAVPVALEQVVLWALVKDPAGRPQSAEELAGALREVRESILHGTINGHVVGVPAAPAFPPPPRRYANPWPWLAVALVLLLIGGGVAAYLLTRAPKVVVPAVTGEQLNVARTQLQNENFAISVINVTSPRPSGTVIGQDPGAGTRAAKGATVTLTVSQGPGVTSVPPVTRLPLAQAEQLIARAGLRVSRVVMESSTQIPRGEVISSDPSAGDTPLAGSGVALFVSSGKPDVTVPDVTGETEAQAKATLEKAGFTVTSTTQTSAGSPAGTVVGESPPGNTQRPYGSSVSIVVAQTPTTVSVPDLIGDSPQAAASALSSAGLSVQQSTQTTSKAAQDGLVISQSPAAGQMVPKGSTVDIAVGKYKRSTKTSTSTTTTPTSTTTTPTTTTTTTTTPAHP